MNVQEMSALPREKLHFDGDLVFVVKDFLGNSDRIAVFDVYLTSNDKRWGKFFEVKDGHLSFFAPAELTGKIDMGELVLIAHPKADLTLALPSNFLDGKELFIVSAG